MLTRWQTRGSLKDPVNVVQAVLVGGVTGHPRVTCGIITGKKESD